MRHQNSSNLVVRTFPSPLLNTIVKYKSIFISNFRQAYHRVDFHHEHQEGQNVSMGITGKIWRRGYCTSTLHAPLIDVALITSVMVQQVIYDGTARCESQGRGSPPGEPQRVFELKL